MKKLVMTGALVLLALLLVGRTEAREPGTFQLSTHMLDISQGAPAPGVAVTLRVQEPDGSWRVVAERRTDANGRIADLLPPPTVRRGRTTVSTGCTSRPIPTSRRRGSARSIPMWR